MLYLSKWTSDWIKLLIFYSEITARLPLGGRLRCYLIIASASLVIHYFLVNQFFPLLHSMFALIHAVVVRTRSRLQSGNVLNNKSNNIENCWFVLKSKGLNVKFSTNYSWLPPESVICTSTFHVLDDILLFLS